MTEIPTDLPQEPAHIPVMTDEVLFYLKPEPGKIYVDATLGAGGHALALLERIQPGGHLIGLDQDRKVLAQTTERLAMYSTSFTPVHQNFSRLETALTCLKQYPVTGGILADIGVSSMQLDEEERGFSFSKEAPLDMRMDRENPKTAQTVVNTYSEKELVRIFSEYGEERFSKTIARRIVDARKTSLIQTTVELADLIMGVSRQIHRDVVKGKSGARQDTKKRRIHPATRVFQALRIEVNDELGHLERFLESLPNCLSPGARVVVISFHSLEDRLVKRAFRNFKKEGLFDVLTPKPIQPSDEEVQWNPRSRSARLRAAERR